MKKSLASYEILIDTKSIIIPYESALLSLIYKDFIIQQDINRILNLIKIHALLHQFDRKKDSKENILANMMDYSVIKDFLINTLSIKLKQEILNGKLLPTIENLRKEYRKTQEGSKKDTRKE